MPGIAMLLQPMLLRYRLASWRRPAPYPFAPAPRPRRVPLLLTLVLSGMLVGAALAEPVPIAAMGAPLPQPPPLLTPLPLRPVNEAIAPQSPRLLSQALTSDASRNSAKVILRQPPFSNEQIVTRWRLLRAPGSSTLDLAPAAPLAFLPALLQTLAYRSEVLLWALLIGCAALLAWQRRARSAPHADTATQSPAPSRTRWASTGLNNRGTQQTTDRDRRSLLLGGAALLLMLLVLGIGASRYLQAYRAFVDQGPAPEVRANPYLAAEAYLRQRGLRVDQTARQDVLPRLPPATTSLLLLGDRSQMTPMQAEQVLTWVRQGGRLVFVAQSLWDQRKPHSADLLLDNLQLRLYLTRDLPPAEPTDDPYPRLTKLYLDNEAAPAYFGFHDDRHLEDPDNLARSWANSGNATHLMQLDYGAGLITVLTDADLWKTNALAHDDNAWLLWYLNQGRDVALIYPTEQQPLAHQLWRYFPQALIVLLTLLAVFAWYWLGRPAPTGNATAWLWRRLSRRQRRLPPATGSGANTPRRANDEQLLRTLQQDILRRARRRHPGFDHLPVAEQWQVLARLTRQPTRAIAQALRPRPAHALSNREFSRQVAHLQHLRNAL